MYPVRKLICDNFKLTSSDTRKPQEYNVSRIALLRCPSCLVRSTALIMASISSTLRTLGRVRPIFGASSEFAGLSPMAPSYNKYLKKDLILDIL